MTIGKVYVDGKPVGTVEMTVAEQQRREAVHLELDIASGAELDKLGANLGLERLGTGLDDAGMVDIEGDDMYRERLRAVFERRRAATRAKKRRADRRRPLDEAEKRVADAAVDVAALDFGDEG